MHAQNLGMVFGREFRTSLCAYLYLFNFHLAATLMRSRDPNAEFSDMAGKALCVEWLVENALDIFDQVSP